ncbi:MAG: hypothetical protein ACRC78_21230 [Planktothrix sp.]
MIMNEIQEYDLVALTEDAIATHKVTHQQILLRRGQNRFNKTTS